MLGLSKKHTVSIIELLVVANFGLIIILLAIKINSGRNHFDKLSDPAAYQAVFLSNNQIYFGHLKNAGADYLRLLDVYYVKVNESGAGQLVKLGQIEPHGPRNEMIINREQVLFWENLRPDSPVVRTIENLQLPTNK